MPIYEYFCPDNRRIYSFFARSLRYADKLPRCPDNPKWKMEKMLSGFAITGKNREEAPDFGGEEVDDARMEAAMDAMEKEFGHVADSANPDPRALAKMMRRMGELTGQKMPAEMNEVIARLERGEDPEKLEAEYGEVFDSMDAFGSEEGGEDPEGRVKRTKKQQRITRDPKLYEMSEYIDEE